MLKDNQILSINTVRFDDVTYNAIRDICYGMAVKGGWWSDPTTGEPITRAREVLISLMHSELSEALEAVRKDLNDDHLTNRKGVEVEFADTIIRIMDYCGGFDINIGWKMKDVIIFSNYNDDLFNSATSIVYMHSELTDALRDVQQEGLYLARCVHRMLRYGRRNNLDIGGAMSDKLAYNAKRQDHKLTNRAKQRGKKF